MIIESLAWMKQTLHYVEPSTEEMLAWQQVNLIPKRALILHRLDRPQNPGLIVSVIDEGP